ncbi:MAG: HEAT repeat domain-containing protein [Gemmatimonadetes bacterium]|nr:HEAT repeat domain-containing protein [Gemmatimonadota bacterium]
MSSVVGLVEAMGLRTSALWLLALVVGALILMALVFAAYAVYLRIHTDRRQRLWEQLSARWEEPVLLALSDPASAPRVHELVAPQHRLHFVRFALEYARRVKGEERRVLQTLAEPYLAPIARRAHSREVEVRTRAVQTLGSLGLPPYAPEVVKALDDPSPLVAMVAARALASSEHPEHAARVLEHLHRFEGWSRSFMASMLAAVGPAAAPALRASFGDAHGAPWVRAVAAEALTMLRDFDAGDLAAAVVSTEDDRELVASALRLLAAVGTPEHVAAVRARCASPDNVVRVHALDALGIVGEEDDLPRLLGAMSDPSPWVAIHAARGLRAAGGMRLLRDLSDSDHPRAALARQVLGEEAGT